VHASLARNMCPSWYRCVRSSFSREPLVYDTQLIEGLKGGYGVVAFVLGRAWLRKQVGGTFPWSWPQVPTYIESVCGGGGWHRNLTLAGAVC